jgi:hypothetical protein
MMRPLSFALVSCTALLGLSGCHRKAAPSPGHVAIDLGWKTDEFPLTMKVYELAADQDLKTWTTGTVKTKAFLPLDKEVEDGRVFLRPGGIKRLALVVENPTAETVRFFASPHGVKPEKLSLGFDFRCLCLNHAYTVPAKKTWFRVVEAKLDKDFQLTDEPVSIVHALIAVDKKRASTMQMAAAVVPMPAKQLNVQFENVNDPKTESAFIDIKEELRLCYGSYVTRHPDDLRALRFSVAYTPTKKGRPKDVRVATAGAAVEPQVVTCISKAVGSLKGVGVKTAKQAKHEIIFGS